MYSQNLVQITPLSANWQMRQASSEEWNEAHVPGCVHTDLIRNKQISDPYFRMNEKDLQWIDKKDWEYKTIFIASTKMLSNKHIEFVFEGLDTYADVFLNEQKILTPDNMFCDWTVDVKPFLKKGENNLRIYFSSPTSKGLLLLQKYGLTIPADNDQAENGGLKKEEQISPFIRKAPYHFGWDWGPRLITSGIWKPVYIRAWNDVRLSDLYIEQLELNDKLAMLNGVVEIQSDKKQTGQVIILVDNVKFKTETVVLEAGVNQVKVPFEIKKPKRWWTNGLGKANLYKIDAQVVVENSIDSKTRNIGLRTLKLIQQPDSIGHSFYFELNGVPVFAKGANHIPNDMFLDRVTHEVYDFEIGTAVKSNMNMLRVWGGGIYEDDYFYELCDRNGIMIWQDFMFACSLYPKDNQFFSSVAKESEYQVKRLRNHASLALWCGNNEIDIAYQYYHNVNGWGWLEKFNKQQNEQNWSAYQTIFNDILPKMAKKLSPAISYIHSSPMTVLPLTHANDTNKHGDVHYWGVWWGKHPFEKYDDYIGRFMSEYGFQSFPELETVKKYALPEDYDIESEVMKHHQRSSIGNVTIKEYMDMYYRKPANFEKFLYVGQVLQAYGIHSAIQAHRRAKPTNMGSLYWQINDCWPVASWSSTDYFRRWKALQYEVKRSFEPIIISAFASGNKTSISVVSDKPTPVSGALELKICDFTGKELQTRVLPVHVNANGVVNVLTEETSKLVQDVEGCFMIMTLKTDHSIITSQNYFFTQPKNLKLTHPSIVSRITETKLGWTISLKSNVLAKNVYLNFPKTEGFFDDNYFDLLPNRETNIFFTPKDKKKAPTSLELMTLEDSYSN